MLGALEFTWPLWGLPLITIPILIHLFNRLRHRKLDWAAMMFLRQASRKSTRYAKLRQWLVLMFRVLAVLALILMLCQPKWNSKMARGLFGGRPDVIVLVVDRSVSMEDAGPEQLKSKREFALQELMRLARDEASGSRVVLMDHTAERPKELKALDSLPDHPMVKATDTGADMLGVMQRIHDWINETKPGSCEVWVASDLQSENWNPDEELRWKAVTDDLRAKDQELTVRVVTLRENARDNYALVVENVEYQKKGDKGELDLTVRIERNHGKGGPLPLEIRLGQSQREEREVALPEGRQPVKHTMTLTLEPEADVGWGSVTLAQGSASSADGNARDDEGFFVYGQTTMIQTAIVGRDEDARAILGFAAAPPSPEITNLTARIYAPEEKESLKWTDNGLVIWQDVLPEGETAAALEEYARDGGVVLFFPANEPGQIEIDGQKIGWGAVDDAPKDSEMGFEVNKWEVQGGPLADTDQGLSLPLLQLETQRRQRITGEGIALASFADGEPFLVRRGVGEGQILFCATLPHEDWSTLTEGLVLLPMVQRLLAVGAVRYGKAQLLISGEDTQEDTGTRWVSVGSTEARTFATEAGVFRKPDGRLVAVNRPSGESDARRIDFEKLKQLFGQVPVAEVKGETLGDQRSAKLWQLMLVFMAAFLLAEARLILPRSSDEGARIPIPKTEEAPTP